METADEVETVLLSASNFHDFRVSGLKLKRCSKTCYLFVLSGFRFTLIIFSLASRLTRLNLPL